VSHYLQGEAALLPPSDLIERLLPTDCVRDSEITRIPQVEEITQVATRTSGVPLSFEFSSYGLEEITSMMDFNMKTGPVVIDWTACDKGVIEEGIAAGAISARARECESATIYFNNGAYVDARFNGVEEELSGRSVLDTIFELFRISMAGLPGVYGYQVASGPMAARIPEIVNLRPNSVNIELMRKLDHERSGVAEDDDDAITRLFDQWGPPPAASMEPTPEVRIEVAADSGFVAKLGLIMEAEETAEIQRAAIAALGSLGVKDPRVDIFVADLAGSLGEVEADESLPAIEQCSAGVMRVRLSSPEAADVIDRETVRVVLNATAQRLQTITGRASSNQMEATDFVAADPVTQSLLSTLRDFAGLDGSKQPLRHILLVGERGSGKEKLANLLHRWSARASEPYVAVNFAAIPGELASAELFGARKGAYTGSDSNRDGLIQAAKAGTLFLDELDEASDALQALIKRVVQFGVFNVVGDPTERKSPARFIAATNEVDVDGLKIKKDLKDRFMVLRVPPLRERRADIRPLAERFARVHQAVLPEPALAFLERLDWPGNVRQLEKVIDRSCAIAGKASGLTVELVRRSAVDESALSEGKGVVFVPLMVGETLESRLEAEEIWQIRYALESCRGHKTHAARDLGVTRQTLANRMKRLGL
jgi:DNA-binding NtrC family response regulator